MEKTQFHFFFFFFEVKVPRYPLTFKLRLLSNLRSYEPGFC